MKPQALTPLIFFAFAAALPACEGGDPGFVEGAYASQISPPAACSNNDPTCNVAYDYPVQSDLTQQNSQNIEFAVGTNQIQLEPGTGLLVDSDGDGVPDPADDCPGMPGWRLPCDGDASNDGIYQTLFYKDTVETTVQADLSITGSIQSADAYILMDATGSMTGEQVQLLNDLTSGTFVPTGQCPTAGGTGIVGALKCSIPDLWIGVGDFKEIGYYPYADNYDQAPYHHYLDTTNNVQHMVDAVAQMIADYNRDAPEAVTQAMYSVITGQGLGDVVPNRGACPSTPAGRWGYPCFRPGVLPIILLFTDAEMYNGPRLASPTYSNPPFDGVLGGSTRLPPVEQSPNVLYSSDPFTAWDLGDLSAKSMTVMGSTKNFGNDAKTWDKGVCKRGSYWSGYWSDGRDAFLKFSLSASSDMFISGQGTAYNTTNVALFDSALGYVTCNGGPGTYGDYWGRFTTTLGAGTWYAVSDGAVSTSSSSAERLGDFQLRFHNLTADPGGYPSWDTATLPIPWTAVETELLAHYVNIVSVISPSTGGVYTAIPDAIELANITGSVDQNGNPYLETIAGDGSGLSTALLDAVRALIGNTRRDVSLVPEDNAATTSVDETTFVSLVTATSCPTNGLNNCLGGQGTSVCNGCLQGAEVGFSFRLGNTTVSQGATPQVFDFDMVGYAGAAEIGRIPVRVMVPEAGDGSYGSGYYENTYDSDVVCEMPPERPDWGTLTWIGSTPSDSTVEFEIYTANTLQELDTVIPVSIVYPTDTTAQSYDVGQELINAGKENWMPFLRIRAKLNASSDSKSTPTFGGWSMEFHCVPFD